MRTSTDCEDVARSRSFFAICQSLIGITLGITVLAGITSCGSVQPTRPYGNLGDSVNSPSDEFAPIIRAGKSALYFTSNRRITDDIYRSDAVDPVGTQPGFSATQIDRSDISRLSQPTTNDGAIAFVTPTTGFFASGHAPDTTNLRGDAFGGIVGGTDIFEFGIYVDGLSVHNPGPAVNSIFWDSHPTAGSLSDTMLVIFASDRPSATGFSSPYSNTFSITQDGDTIAGNADLYYAFRAGGVWGSVRNFNEAINGSAVNSIGNEYSPFLFCVEERPRLFFASNRGESYDIYEAELSIDFGGGMIDVKSVAPLPSGDNGVNSTDDELFPHLSAYPLGGDPSHQYLFFASNRAGQKQSVGEKTIQSVGGYDLYRIALARECRPPTLRYEVVVLDAEDPTRPVLSPVVHLHSLAAASEIITEEPKREPSYSSTTNPAVFNLPFGSEYSAFGGSTHNEIRCEENVPTIESYRYRWIGPGRASVTRRTEYRMRDTILGVRRIVGADTLITDTIAIDDASALNVPVSVIEAVRRHGDSLVITRRVRYTADRIEGGKPSTYRAAVAVYDSVFTTDTLFIPTTERLVPSARVARYGNLDLPTERVDAVVRDTIYVWPKYYQAPPCEWLYTRSISDEYEKNVPYFQTAFWEVNTTANFREHRSELGGSAYRNAGFIELHPENQYFGVSSGAKRAVRIAEYGAFAGLVDRNLARMASEICEQIIPEFLEYNEKSPNSNNRLVIEISAFSDVRPIQRGWYTGSNAISYLAGGYDTASGSIHLYDVNIAPGASLVSQNNETLSQLRAWFGYRELLARLGGYKNWKTLIEDGTILLPTPGMSPNEYRARMESAKILVVTEGRQVDRSATPNVTGYVHKGNDFYSLDDVRRIDVRVNRLEYINGRLIRSPCCR